VREGARLDLSVPRGNIPFDMVQTETFPRDGDMARELTERLQQVRRKQPTLDERLRRYRELRRAYDELRGSRDDRETVAAHREQATERKYVV